MTVQELIQRLESSRDAALHLMLPSGRFVPSHFHVTEVGRVQKTFVDCGGTRRESESCLLQVWTADDIEHRLSAGKLAGILTLAGPLLGSGQLPLEVEYGEEIASQYHVSDVEVTPGGLLFVLTGKKTDCLAKDKCGVESCCSGSSGCC